MCVSICICISICIYIWMHIYIYICIKIGPLGFWRVFFWGGEGLNLSLKTSSKFTWEAMAKARFLEIKL